MRAQLPDRKHERGVMLIEALLAILIFSVGILAVVGMQGAAIKTVTDAKYRSEASFLANSLMAQIWIDAGNIASYDYPGSGTPPSRLTGWVDQVKSRLPGTTGLTPVLPIVTITGSSAQGATVQIQVRWRLPEETTLGLPPHNQTVIAAVYTS